MTPTKWLTSLVMVGLLLVGGALFFFRAPPAPPASVPVAATTSSVTLPPAATPVAKSFRDGVPMQRVMELYQSESKRIGQVDPDPKATEKRLEESARELTPAEIRWLEGQSSDIKNDADARFFGVYLLGLSHNEASVGALGRIAVSPVPQSKNDRWVEQERALRASAIEGACHSCKEFPAAVKDVSLDVVSRQQDEFLRDRANRCLYFCQYGKPIEEQDKEALRKLRGEK